MLRIAPYLILFLILTPIAAGLIGTLVPAFGYFPALGANDWSWQPLLGVLRWPGLAVSLGLSLFTGFAATLISFLALQFLLALVYDRPWLARLSALAAPLVAVPHAALAVGLVFLLAPSGWIMRLISPTLTGYQRPPDWLFPGDGWGAALILGLVIKELPYLLLVSLAGLSQLPTQQSLAVARSLGHTRLSAWFRCILPQLYPQLRLPLFAVLAFSVSNVDMALILGPNTPPSFAVQVLRWFSDPDLSLRLQAAAGASLLTLALLLSLGVWVTGERLIWRLGLWRDQGWLIWGPHAPRPVGWIGGRWFERSAVLPAIIVLALGLLALLPLVIWSFARRWRFPDALPSRWSLDNWQDHSSALFGVLTSSLTLALVVAFLAISLVVLSLEKEARFGRRLSGRSLELLKYFPLLVPQTSFLFGVQVLAIASGLFSTQAGLWLLVGWAHLLYVLPYGFISLSLAYHSLDPRLIQTAQSLGHGPWIVFWRIKLPMLFPSLLLGLAIGVAVSISQYLPTLLLSGGKITTLTTETLSLSAGGDRRLLALYALAQAGLPFLGFALAILLPRLLYWNRDGMRA